MSPHATRAWLLGPAVFAGFVQLMGSFGAAARQPTARPLDALAVALLLVGPLALLARRRFPIPTLLATVAALLGYLFVGYAYGPIVVSFVLALVSAVVLGRRRAAWAVTAMTYTAMVAIFWMRSGGFDEWAVSGLAAWLLVLLAVGELIRGRQERQARQRRERAEAAERLATEERLRIARDLHDVLAHHVSLINVQAGTALHLLDEQPGLARDALTAIKASSKEVLVELRTMLGVLRRVDEQAPRAPTAGLAGLDELAERLCATGLPVSVHRAGRVRPLPTAVDTAAYRIVQEALTNVHRHAGEARATVLVDYSNAAVVVQVDDDGRGAGDATGSGANARGDDNGGGNSAGSGGVDGGGNGIPGMRERATALGGQLRAGKRPGGGFRVRAELPLPPDGTERARPQ